MDQRSFDPMDSTVHDGSRLVYYSQHNFVTRTSFGGKHETPEKGFEYGHIGFKLIFNPFEDDAQGASFILGHYRDTSMIVVPANPPSHLFGKDRGHTQCTPTPCTWHSVHR